MILKNDSLVKRNDRQQQLHLKWRILLCSSLITSIHQGSSILQRKLGSSQSKETETPSEAVGPALSLAGTLKQSWSTGKPVKGQGRNRNPETERRGCLRPGRENTTGQNCEAKKGLLLFVVLGKSDGHTRDLLKLVYTEIWLVSFSGESILCAVAGLH